MKKPKISVLMAVYNQEQFIKESIKSILNQNFKDFEFLILDDASKDKTLSVIKEFQKQDNRIKLFKNKKNLGLTRSLIKLSKHIKGNLIARMDADDISDKNRFLVQAKWFDDDTKVLLGSSGYWIDKNNITINNIDVPISNSNKLKEKLRFTNLFLHSSTMFRKKYFFKVGGYRNFFEYSQDYDLWCRISKYGKIGNIKKKLIKIRKHENSISTKKKRKQMFYAIVASCLNQYPKIRLNKNIFEKISKTKDLSLHFRCLRFLYFEYLPKKWKLRFNDLKYREKLYLAKDINFSIKKYIKNVLYN